MPKKKPKDKKGYKEDILIIDLGSPYTQLLAQRVRENHVFSRIISHKISAKELKLLKPKGIIVSGDGSSGQNKKSPLFDKGILKISTPILVIGSGLNAIIPLLGGRVQSSKVSEFKRCELFIDNTHNLFWQMPSTSTLQRCS